MTFLIFGHSLLTMGIEQGSEEIPAITERIREYFPRPEVLVDYTAPKILDLEEKDRVEKTFPDARISLVRDHTTGKFVFAPTWHPIQGSLPHNPGLHYAHISFEGSSLLPVRDDDGNLIGANLVLHEARMERFKKSIASLGLINLIDENLLSEFSQGVIDLASMSRNVLLKNLRGYVRPWAIRDDTTVGVAPKKTDFLAMGAFIMSMGKYLKDEAYQEGAVSAAFLASRREVRILGKNAMNYGAAGDIGARAAAVGAHEAALLGPYWIDPSTGEKRSYSSDEHTAQQQALKGGLIVDGPGEDLVFFTPDGYLLYQPMDTNILAGTTRRYITTYLAPYLGIRTREWPVTINDIKKGRVVGAAYTGNAVGFCGVRVFKFLDANGMEVEALDMNITPEIRSLTKRFAEELSGRVPTAGPLLTPVDLASGDKALEMLQNGFKGWF